MLRKPFPRKLTKEEIKQIIMESTQDIRLGFLYIAGFFGLIFLFPAFFTLIGKTTKSFWILSSLWAGASIPFALLWFRRYYKVKKIIRGKDIEVEVMASSSDTEISEEHQNIMLRLASVRHKFSEKQHKAMIHFVLERHSYVGLVEWKASSSSLVTGDYLWIRIIPKSPQFFLLLTEGLPVSTGYIEREIAPKRRYLWSILIAILCIGSFFSLIQYFVK